MMLTRPQAVEVAELRRIRRNTRWTYAKRGFGWACVGIFTLLVLLQLGGVRLP